MKLPDISQAGKKIQSGDGSEVFSGFAQSTSLKSDREPTCAVMMIGNFPVSSTNELMKNTEEIGENGVLIFLVLDFGREIWAEECLVSQTQLSASGPEDFERIYQWPTPCDRVFPKCPFCVLEPHMAVDSDSSYFRPPPFRIMARFFSTATRFASPEQDASELVIIWFQEVPYPFMSSENRSSLDKLNWDEHAKDSSW